MKLWCAFDVAQKKEQIANLEAESMAADFWADNRKAQAHMQQMNALREEVNTWESVAERLNDLQGLAGLLEEEPDEAMREEIAQEVAAIEQEVDKLQFALMLNGEHDERNAIMSIHAGSGGVDAQDWQRCCFACISAGPSSTTSAPRCTSTTRVMKRAS